MTLSQRRPSTLTLPLLTILLGALTLAAEAQPPHDTPWAHVTAPAKGAPHSIGEYSAGCLRGAAKLELDGTGYQVMHPSRLRYYGNPDLVDFIRKLGRALHAEGVGDMMVGDMSQPRGGPAPGGHSSHQTGLDVDLWFWQPKAAAKGPLPRADRESLKSKSVLDGKAGIVSHEFAPRVAALLRLAASDIRVTRIFVHPIIKRDLCAATEGDRAWLNKLRPWYGHDDHFHVRLACPQGDNSCVKQMDVADGDGCSELDWWFSKSREDDRQKGQATYQAKVGRAPGMPAECAKLIEGVVTSVPDTATPAADGGGVANP